MFGSIDLKQSEYYLTGVLTSKIGPPYYVKGLFGKVNSDSSLVFINPTQPTDSCKYEIFLNSLKNTDDGNFVAVGNKYDSTSKAFLMKIDGNGNNLIWKEYTDSNSVIFQGMDVVPIAGQGYLIAINKSQNQNNNFVVIRTDTNGVELNRQEYEAGFIETPWAIRAMVNGHFMVGGYSKKIGSSTPFWSKSWLIEIDSMGNMIDDWLDTDNKNLWLRSMQQTADSGWIVVRQHIAYDVNDFQKLNASIVKLDKNYNRQWEHYMGDSGDVTGFYDVEILPDGKYIACGNTPIWGSDSAHRWGWIVKFDTNGTVLWDKKYLASDRNGTHNLLNDIDVLPNGDLLACGELRLTFDVGITPMQQGWILRVDSNGCEVENCLVGIEDPQAPKGGLKGQIQIQPNPASDRVWVEVESGMLGGELKLYDISGRLVKQLPVEALQFGVEVSDLCKGVYVISIEHEGVLGRGKLVKE